MALAVCLVTLTVTSELAGLNEKHVFPVTAYTSPEATPIGGIAFPLTV